MVNEKDVSPGSQGISGRTKVAYIIGPIRSKWGLIGRLINIWRGRCAAAKLWKAGFAVICPHLNSFTIQWAIKDEDKIVELDCEIIRRCDFVVILKRWEESRGCRVEVNYCLNNNKRRYYNINYVIRDEEG